MEPMKAIATGMAMLLVGCSNASTPTFVRFDRGEVVEGKIFRSQDDRCRVVIMLDHRSYSSRLSEPGCP